MNKTLGFIKMSDAEYFAAEGISNSFLIQFDRSPAHALTGIKQTSSMSDGTLLHKFILCPDEFLNEYVIAPEGMTDRRKKDYLDFKKLNEDKEIILFSDFQELEIIKNNIMSYEIEYGVTIADIFEKSEPEIAFFWEEVINGKTVLRKGKADKLYQGNDYNLILELKKTENCLDFLKSIKFYKYYRQAATYIDGTEKITGKPTKHLFITVEMEKPFGVKVYQIDEAGIERGRLENLFSLENYLEWEEAGKPEKIYNQGIKIITI